MKKLLLICFVLICPVFIFAQADKAAATAEVKNIDAYTKKIDAFVKRNKAPQLVFADTASQTSTRSRWRRFASEKALDTFRAKSETYEIAYCWKQTGNIVEVSTTLFSGSGDWVNYVYHYFRADGSLAKVESDFRSFYGDLIVEQEVYYGANGKQLKKNVHYRDLKTRKFKKVDPKSDPISLSKFDTYKTVKKLPFAHLLAKKK
jgi:hypothetical protein